MLEQNGCESKSVMVIEKEQNALSAKLNLLADVMNLHGWTVFGQKEAAFRQTDGG